MKLTQHTRCLCQGEVPTVTSQTHFPRHFYERLSRQCTAAWKTPPDDNVTPLTRAAASKVLTCDR
ncbi:hypothetical protein E2C01_081096 [Portunus trituberculatus]|uniref:Uncharacterized protein n=1 Tax=Portunus trituberculatus TaxID=210409 RepID=A0A5B7IVC1_PORTR|nr:hypothetical protein [Portunus trituberculatus]